MKNYSGSSPKSPVLPTWLFYALAAFFLLFFALGQRALSGSEDRWAEIVRNMLLYQDWFHPIINDEVYFDKPLLSYWLIVAASYLAGGLNEFTVRLPGAISALLTLFCTYRIALELFDRQVAKFSVLLAITSYGFLFWSRTASAELSNLALISAAVAWFVHHRDNRNFSAYLVFYLICAVGCQLKGLTAIVVPLLVVLPFVLRQGRWKTHINLSHALALVLPAALFLLPYVGASYFPLPAGIEAQHNHLSGLDLLIRENIVRFFEPFDHVDPIYSYLYAVPRILFPWMFLFLAAVAHYAARYRRLDESRRWVLEAIAVIFLFFTFSGSRRWYYILPIMPFCMILISAYMTEENGQRLRRLATNATLIVALAFAALLLVFPVAFKAYARNIVMPGGLWIGSAVIGVAIVAILVLGKKRMEILQGVMRTDPRLPASMPLLLIVAALAMIVVFGFALPGADSYRQLKPFALSLSAQASSGEQFVFFKKANTALAFYLNSKEPIPVVNAKSELPPAAGKCVIIVEVADQEDLFNSFPELRNATPVLRETRLPKKFLSDSLNFVAYRLG